MDIDISIRRKTFSERDAGAAVSVIRDFAARQLGDSRLILAAHYRIGTRRVLGLFQRYEVEVSLRTVYPKLIVVSRSASTVRRAAEKAGGKALSRLSRFARKDASLARTDRQSVAGEIG